MAEAGVSTDVIGTTGNRQFWSVDRGEYVQAGSLELGERLLTLHGDTKRVVNKLARPGPTPVFNLEVHGEHVYYVGQQGLLVHNSQRYDAPTETDVAFGLSSYKNANLSDFTSQIRLQSGRDVRAYFANFGGFTRLTTQKFGRKFNDVTRRAARIHFNLDAIDDPVAAALAGRGGFGRGKGVPWTFAELNLIRTTPELLKKTRFYRTNKASGIVEEVTSPF